MNIDSANAARSEKDRPQGMQARRGLPNRLANFFTRRVRGSTAANKQLSTLLDLARQEYADKKFADTLRTCDLILELDPENYFALRYIARIHTLRGDDDRAEPIWRRLCTNHRNKVEPAINVARLAEKREHWDTLAEFADLALHEDPERLEALRMSVHARVRTEHLADLMDLLPRLFAKEPERALRFLRDLDNPEQLPVLAEAFVRKAQTLMSDHDLEAFKEQSQTVWLVGARRATADREDRLTGSCLRTVLAFDPSSREAIEGLAVLSRESLINLRRAISKRDYSAAIHHAEIAIEINPMLVEAWFSLARLLEEEDPDRAVNVFRTCAKLRPGEAYYLARLGRSLRNARRPVEALGAYEQARALTTAHSNPRSAEIVAAIAELRPLALRRGRELSDEGRFKEAWAHFYAATGRSPLEATMYLAAAAFRSKITVHPPHFGE